MNTPLIPVWSLDSIYPSISSDAYREDLESIEVLCHLLKKEIDAFQADAEHVRHLIGAYEELVDTHETLDAYVHALMTIDTTDPAAVQGIHDVARKGLLVKESRIELIQTLASHSEEVLALIGESADFERSRFVIQEMLDEASHMMSAGEEAVAYALQTTGADAFSRLHEVITSTSSISWSDDGSERKTLTELRALAFSPDRSVRKKGFEKELELLKREEIPLCFALNGVKGSALTLYKKRSYEDAIAVACASSRISSEVLNALITSLEDHRSLFVRYFKAKAHALALPSLSFYDLFAPIGEESGDYTFEEARSIIVDSLSRFHPEMGKFAEKAFASHWIDARIRGRKVGGAYCTFFPKRKESRILCNFDGSFDALSTVAHELGHGYHDSLVKDIPATRRAYPMTLAETASIFSQFIIFTEELKGTGGSEAMNLLDSFLQDASQVCIDILSRYYFEKDVFAKVASGEANPSDFCRMMEQAQKESYLEGLNHEELHPYMWAVKGHYYSADLPFYNYPYAFGQLFALGIYSRYEKESEGFSDRFDALLRVSGEMDAASVADTIGCDIRERTFWDESFAVIERYVDEFVRMSGMEKE